MGNNIFGKKESKETNSTQKSENQSKAVLNLFERQKDIESSLDLLGEKIAARFYLGWRMHESADDSRAGVRRHRAGRKNDVLSDAGFSCLSEQ